MTDQEYLRTRLIDVATNPNRATTTYGKIAGNRFKTFPHKNNPFYDGLVELSLSEQKAGRPPLSVLAIRDETGAIPGQGFFERVLNLDYKELSEDQKRKIFERYRDAAFDYWSGESVINNDPTFFTFEEITALDQIANQPYDKDNPEHRELKATHIDSIHEKIEYWARQLTDQLPGFQATVENRWLKPRSKFRDFSWGRIYRVEHGKNSLFFTLAVATSPASLEYKIDCKFDGNERLTDEEVKLIRSNIPAAAETVRIPLVSLSAYNWPKLVAESLAYIRNHEDDYDWLHLLLTEVTQTDVAPVIPQETLVVTDPPLGLAEFLPRNPTFRGRNPDYVAISGKRSKLGKAGEELVKRAERKKLRKAGLHNLADRVESKQDGEGYDVISWDENSRELHIEVKTTTRDINTPFFISRNELDYAELKKNKDHYVIYRVYDYSIRHKTGKMYIINDVADSIVTEATAFKAFYKGVS